MNLSNEFNPHVEPIQSGWLNHSVPMEDDSGLDSLDSPLTRKNEVHDTKKNWGELRIMDFELLDFEERMYVGKNSKNNDGTSQEERL